MEFRIYLFLFIGLVSASSLFLPVEAEAHCDGVKHADGHPHCAGGSEPPPEPENCFDNFPAFVYTKSNNNNGLDELRVSSSEGCRTELLAIVQASHGPAFSYDNNQGLVAWTENTENYDLTILKFSYDPSTDIVSIGTPQTILATARPSNTEYFFDLDTWVDYNASPNVELISFLRHIVADARSSIEVIDLAQCDSSGCVSNVITDNSDSERETCIANAGAFDSTPEVFPECFMPYGVAFNSSGDALFVQADALDWQSIMRIGIVFDESQWQAQSLDLVAVDNTWDCESGALPTGRGNAVSLVAGREVYASSACIGFKRGIRDQRLYFLDVPKCIDDPRGWQGCIHPDLQSGDYTGVLPSWFPSGEILYNGFTPKSLGSLRVFDPNLENPANDRQVVDKADSGDSGL